MRMPTYLHVGNLTAIFGDDVGGGLVATVLADVDGEQPWGGAVLEERVQGSLGVGGAVAGHDQHWDDRGRVLHARRQQRPLSADSTRLVSVANSPIGVQHHI